MGDTLQVAASLHLPEAAKRMNHDASFSGRAAATPQPLGNHPRAISRRSAEELLTALRKGTDLLKHGRLGRPKMHFFRLADADSLLTWRSANGKPRGIALSSVKQVIKGQATETFKRHPLPHMAHASFSLIYRDLDMSSRTLDLTCRTEQEFELWYWGIQVIIDRLSAAGAPQKPVIGAPTGEVMQSAKSVQLLSAGTPLQSSTAKVGRVTGAMGLPVLEHRPGDCYVWGSSNPNTGFPLSQASISHRQHCAYPVIVDDSTHLDVHQVAVGLRHAALVTRSGEAYTWGSGAGGRLGLGHAVDACAPQRVHTLWGQRIESITAGDGCTAAVSEEGALYTWGDGAAGDLGYCDALRQFIPRRVEGALLDHIITQVSCGPYHTAAVSATGALFTWGDGLCGKLGHGTLDSCSEPRQVEALASKRVIHVACGVWHTAAVAAEPIGGSSPPPSLSELSYAEAEALRHKLSAAYDMLDEEGGSLFTWGGQFTWVEHKKDAAGHATDKKDHNRGCLGLGDTTGRLLPTRVEGALQGLAVRQVDCGLNLTVALTTDGRIWQMGETGSPGNKHTPWEGAREPQQVSIPGHFVERVAVGMQHVAALAGPLDGQTGRAEEGEERSVIFMWGRGREGQLGGGLHADNATPSAVDELRGRHVLQVACGGCYTLAVCRHDADKEDTEERRRGYKGKMRAWFSTNNRPLITVPEKAEMLGLKLPRDSASTPFAEERAASIAGSLASFTPTSDMSTPRSEKTAAHSSAKHRVSLVAGARAFSTSLAVQLRRHSGEAFAASQRFLAGAKTPAPLSSEQSGPRRATSPEWDAAAPVTLAETSASMSAPHTSGINAQGIQADVLMSPASEGRTVHTADKVSDDHGHDQTLYIAALENRVAQLEALLGRRTAVPASTSSQPLEPLPSPFRAAPQQRPSFGNLLSARRHSSATLSPRGSAEEGSQHLTVQASDRSEHDSSRGLGEEASTAPVRRMLQLSPERSQSVSPQPQHRRSHSLAEWSAAAAPLWQPHEQIPSSTTPSTPPGQHTGPPKPQQSEQLPSSPQPTSSNSTGGPALQQDTHAPVPAAHTSTEASGSGRHFSGDTGLPGRPHSPVFRTSTIDVGALMGGSPWRPMGSPHSRLGSPDSPTSRALRDHDNSSSSSIFHTRLRPDSPVHRPDMARPQNREEEGTWALQQAAAMQRQVQRERAELAQLRSRLEEQEARLAARARELQLADSPSSMPTPLPLPTVQTLPHNAPGDDRLSGALERAGTTKASQQPMRFGLLQTGHEETVEVFEGVFLTLEATPSGQNALTRIRFARGRFSRAQAEAWWRAHKAEVAQHYNLVSMSLRAPSETPATLPDPNEGGTPFHTPPCSPFDLQGGEVIADPRILALPSPPLTDPPQTHPMSDDQQISQRSRVADSLPEQPYREQQLLQHEVSCWESTAAGPQQHRDSGWPGPPWEHTQSAASPAHSASAYAWCCEDDAALTNTAHRSVASFGGYSLEALSPELSSAGSPVAIGGCSTDPGDSAAVLSSRADQPRTCSEDAQKYFKCHDGISAEDGAARVRADVGTAEELEDARSAGKGHSRGADTGAASTAIVPALRTEQSCQETGPQPLQAVSGANIPQMASAENFMQLDMSRACHDDGAQIQPPSLGNTHAIAAL
ncbi:probable E3 ubiquitin-protein ligase HERC2 at N-terminal half [Coccomyxa sp. Obi]|nr:probable E3 ubiquitin-protein ligase HERC2 at N-terminal half [Coccomyxa sp. Obi]